MKTKKGLLTCIFIMFISTSIFSQCTPDPLCVDTGYSGEICPVVLPDGIVGTPYSQSLTVIPLDSANVSGSPLVIIKNVWNSIDNLPPGLSYQCNPANCDFACTDPITRYCVLLSGTPTSAGTYSLTINITPYMDMFGSPVALPQQTITSYSITINSSSAVVPTLSTTAISGVTSTTALSGGNITSAGGATVISRGVCWSTSTNPVANGLHTTNGTGIGSFTSNLTSLSPSTTYYVRAYATNSVGTAYGNQVSFITSPSATVPTVTTTSISAVTDISAVSGGNVTSDGGDPVTSKGVCWSTSANPIISNSHTTNGTGTGVFTSDMSGLSSNTTYHVRAYATNSAGTAYGNDVSFSTTSTVTSTQKLCIVTVDTITWKNKILWEKEPGIGTVSYNIYKEQGANIYVNIGNVPYSSQASFIDNNSVPESHGDKYKITAVNNSSIESTKSPYHKTMNLVISSYGNTVGLSWTAYVDESGIFEPIWYYIYRGTQPNNLQLIDSISGSFTSYNDNNVFNVYYYLVGVKKADGCNITKNTPFISFSNRKQNVGSGICEFYLNTLSIYPNPANDKLNIDIEEKATLEILNVQGQIVETRSLTEKTNTLDISKLASGVYTLRIKTDRGIAIRKLIKQ